VAGPGGREIGRVSVRVLPDTAVFGRSLSRYLARVERSSRVQITATLDDKQLAGDARRLAKLAEQGATVTVPAELDTDRVESEFQRLVRGLAGESVSLRVDLDQRDLARVQQAGRDFTRLASVTFAIGGLAAATSGLAGLAVGAAQAAGALLVLPAAGFAAAAALGTLVVGMQGFGTALSSMDDPAAFAEALENLAPSARETAQAVKALQPAFTGLRLDVQERLFAGMAATITQLAGSYLPILRTGLGGIAGELNTGARAFADFLTSSQSLGDTSSILGNVRSALAALAPAGVAFAAVLRDITTVGSSFLPGLAGGLASAAERFRAFIAEARASGQLATWIQGGITAVGQLGQILRNLGSIVASVFGALDNSGGGFLAFLADATGQLAALLDSAQGAEVLGALAEFAATAGTALSGVLGAALTELGPVLAELAPALSVFVTQLSGAFVTALRIAGPLLQQFASFLSANASWLGPVIIGLGTIAAVAGPLISGLTTLISIVRVASLVFAGLNAVLIANPIGLIITAIGALVAAFVWLWNNSAGFRDFWKGVWDGILAAVNWAIDGVKSVWDNLVNFFTNTTLGQIIIGIFDAIGTAIGAVIDAIQWLIDRISDAIDWVSDLIGDIGEALGLGGEVTKSFQGRGGGGKTPHTPSALGIAAPTRLVAQISGSTAQGFAHGFTHGIRDATPLAAHAANQVATAATFDPVRTDLGATNTTGSGSAVTVQQTINAAPEQSPWAIATAANRQLGYAMRTGGTP
jgi:hypothetical protein